MTTDRLPLLLTSQTGAIKLPFRRIRTEVEIEGELVIPGTFGLRGAESRFVIRVVDIEAVRSLSEREREVAADMAQKCFAGAWSGLLVLLDTRGHGAQIPVELLVCLSRIGKRFGEAVRCLTCHTREDAARVIEDCAFKWSDDLRQVTERLATDCED